MDYSRLAFEPMAIPPFSLLGRANTTDKDSNEGIYTRRNTHPPKSRPNIFMLSPNGFPPCLTLALAVLFGSLLAYCFLFFNYPLQYKHVSPPNHSSESTISIPDSPIAIPDAEHPGLEALRDMVAHTKGYWARDWSLWIGWNNVSCTYLLNMS